MGRINMTIDDDVYKVLQEMAQKDERSLANYLRRMLRIIAQNKLDLDKLSQMQVQTYKKSIIN